MTMYRYNFTILHKTVTESTWVFYKEYKKVRTQASFTWNFLHTAGRNQLTTESQSICDPVLVFRSAQ